MDTDIGLTTFQYDSLNRLTNVIHPDAAAIQAAFDANNRLGQVGDLNVVTQAPGHFNTFYRLQK